jgi:hypothetical protein
MREVSDLCPVFFQEVFGPRLIPDRIAGFGGGDFPPLAGSDGERVAFGLIGPRGHATRRIEGGLLIRALSLSAELAAVAENSGVALLRS